MGLTASGLTLALLLSTITSPTAPRRVVHVIVALADNRYQGIVPVPAAIGDGDVPNGNLYWGAGYGIRTFFQRSAQWESIGRCAPGASPVLERCIFHNKQEDVYVVADAYRGREIKRAVADFFAFSAGQKPESVTIPGTLPLSAAGSSQLVVYVGHDGLMD